MPETIEAPTVLEVTDLPDAGDIPCPNPKCNGAVVEVERGLAWRPLSVRDDGAVLSYEDSEPSWEGDGFQCNRCFVQVTMPDDFEPQYV